MDEQTRSPNWPVEQHVIWQKRQMALDEFHKIHRNMIKARENMPELEDLILNAQKNRKCYVRDVWRLLAKHDNIDPKLNPFHMRFRTAEGNYAYWSPIAAYLPLPGIPYVFGYHNPREATANTRRERHNAFRRIERRIISWFKHHD